MWFNVWSCYCCSCIPANVPLDFDPATLNTAASASTGLFTHLPHPHTHTYARTYTHNHTHILIYTNDALTKYSHTAYRDVHTLLCIQTTYCLYLRQTPYACSIRKFSTSYHTHTHTCYTCMQWLISSIHTDTLCTHTLSLSHLQHTFICTHTLWANTQGRSVSLSALPFCSTVLLLVGYYYYYTH